MQPEISLAPMLAVTTTPFRQLIRLISKSTVLFTEMIVAETILHLTDAQLIERLGHSEKNTVVQIGGNNAKIIAKAIYKLKNLNYTHFNLNCGCPSSKVRKGCFGAFLMLNVDNVINILNTVYEETGIVLSIKCRTGVVDDEDKKGKQKNDKLCKKKQRNELLLTDSNKSNVKLGSDIQTKKIEVDNEDNTVKKIDNTNKIKVANENENENNLANNFNFNNYSEVKLNTIDVHKAQIEEHKEKLEILLQNLYITKREVQHSTNYFETFDFFYNFISQIIKRTKTYKFYIHARSCILNGLSADQNRKIPPLNYAFVYKIKALFPEAKFYLNGGIKDLRHFKNLDGVMIGREARKNVLIFKELENEEYRVNKILRIKYIRNLIIKYFNELDCDKIVFRYVAPIMNLLQGMKGSKRYKIMIDGIVKDGLGLEVAKTKIDDFFRQLEEG